MPVTLRTVGDFEAKQNGENQCVDGAHADDDGRMRHGGVAQSDGEADLIDGDSEKAEIDEGPEIFEAPSLLAGAGGFGKNGKTAAKGEEEDEEDGGEDDAERGEGEWRPITERDFASDEVDGPDGQKDGDGRVDGGAAGRGAVGRVYAHG